MAKYPLYVVRDKVKGFIPSVFLDQNEQSAYRGFAYQINNDPFYKYSPSDYDLFKIGVFDTDSGAIDSNIPEFIVNGASVFNEK